MRNMSGEILNENTGTRIAPAICAMYKASANIFIFTNAQPTIMTMDSPFIYEFAHKIAS